MAELKVYRCVVNGQQATLRLTEEDAKRYNAVPLEPAPAVKARPAAEAAHTPSNKAR